MILYYWFTVIIKIQKRVVLNTFFWPIRHWAVTDDVHLIARQVKTKNLTEYKQFRSFCGSKSIKNWPKSDFFSGLLPEKIVF